MTTSRIGDLKKYVSLNKPLPNRGPSDYHKPCTDMQTDHFALLTYSKSSIY